MINLNAQPDIIMRELMRLIKNVCPEAVMAGGAVFDTLVGCRYRDLDVFIFPTSKSKLTKLKQILNVEHTGPWIKSDYGAGVRRVIDFHFKGVKGQLIIVDNIQKRLNSFDLTFRMMVYDGSKIKVLPKALHAIQSRKLVVNSFHSPMKTLIRMVRFKDRYDKIDFRLEFDKGSIEQLCIEALKHWPSSEKNLYRECSRELAIEIRRILFRYTGSELVWNDLKIAA